MNCKDCSGVYVCNTSLLCCPNFKKCKNNSNGLCDPCLKKYGDYQSVDIVKVCPICLEKKSMIQLPCKHQYCEECWHTKCETTTSECCLCS